MLTKLWNSSHINLLHRFGASPTSGLYRLQCFTIADGMLGLFGFTVIVSRDEEMTRSMSSIGTAPSSTVSPITRAPVMSTVFSSRSLPADELVRKDAGATRNVSAVALLFLQDLLYL